MTRKYGRRDASSAYKIFSLPLWIALRCDFPAAGLLPVGQRVARSFPERWPAVLPRDNALRFKAINSRTGEGQPGRCPFL